MKLVEGFDSNYRYVLVAARRARQIQNGARPVVDPHSREALPHRGRRNKAGKVKWEIPAAGKSAAGAENGKAHEEPVGGDADD